MVLRGQIQQTQNRQTMRTISKLMKYSIIQQQYYYQPQLSMAFIKKVQPSKGWSSSDRQLLVKEQNLNHKIQLLSLLLLLMDKEPQHQSAGDSTPIIDTKVAADDKFDHQIGFALDIDGTLMLSHQQIPGASEALNTLTRNNIPYILVTNNISRSEQTKADELNKVFKLDVPITADQIILNITPLKTYMPWKDKVILIVIRENEAKDRLPFEQIPYYITIDEYCTIFPDTVPLSRRKLDENAMEVKTRVEKRLNIQNIDQRTLKIGAVLVINCPLRWEECYQVIIDLLSSEDGCFHQIHEYKYIENHIPILTALNDMYFRTKYHPLPRILIRPFNEGLKSVYKQIYGKDLKILTFGKPERNTFEFIEKFMARKYGKVKKIVVIGDNEETDIVGAYNYGWESVLVLTGITEVPSQKANFTCNTVLQGLSKYGIYPKPKVEEAASDLSKSEGEEKGV